MPASTYTLASPQKPFPTSHAKLCAAMLVLCRTEGGRLSIMQYDSHFSPMRAASDESRGHRRIDADVRMIQIEALWLHREADIGPHRCRRPAPSAPAGRILAAPPRPGALPSRPAPAVWPRVHLHRKLQS
eukprot:357031-Chlamydomonas_euryale.AAC.10